MIDQKNTVKIRQLLRIKFLMDAAKGIQYLHINGVLHRDIKPDNLLVVSLEENVNVNCKLTDFGSSRNISMLMTNMLGRRFGSVIYLMILSSLAPSTLAASVISFRIVDSTAIHSITLYPRFFQI